MRMPSSCITGYILRRGGTLLEREELVTTRHRLRRTEEANIPCVASHARINRDNLERTEPECQEGQILLENVVEGEVSVPPAYQGVAPLLRTVHTLWKLETKRSNVHHMKHILGRMRLSWRATCFFVRRGEATAEQSVPTTLTLALTLALALTPTLTLTLDSMQISCPTCQQPCRSLHGHCCNVRSRLAEKHEKGLGCDWVMVPSTIVKHW